ncbi:MAG: GIY-YIG nuclease family protein [Candidatus Bathyarchaeota archaeon]|jgi:putative endonuclease|nr:GIY-YIG nuclease family protein [Candidatus Bathyarchaeota archaeon]
MPYYVYMIACEDGGFYTGCTKNVDLRFRLHMTGSGARYTRMHKPKKLVYVEEVESRSDAMKREKVLKRLSHSQKAKLAKSALRHCQRAQKGKSVSQR